MKRSTFNIVVAIFTVLILAIAWDIAAEFNEKGALRSAGRVLLFILSPVLIMTRALRNERKRNRQPHD